MTQPSSCLLTVLDLVPFGQTGQESRFFALRLTRPDWPSWRPGQFVMVRPTSFGLEMPWARPFGICHMTSRHLICFFQVVGRGTRRMAELKAGDTVRVWGPLGNGFAMEPDTPTLLLAGGISLANLPVAEYPEIAPPTLFVSATYSGASADVVAQTVAMPLENEINGVEDLLYFSSTRAIPAPIPAP